MRSTDSLNPSAIFILCPAIPSQRRILDSFSASASFTCIIFFASASLSAASLNFSVSIILFIADITVPSNLTSLTWIESSVNQKLDSFSLNLISIASQISSLFAKIFLWVNDTIIALSCSSIVALIIVLGSSISYIDLKIFQCLVFTLSSFT